MRRFLLGLLLALTALFASPAIAQACTTPASVCPNMVIGALPIIRGGRPLPVLVDGAIDAGAVRAAQNLETDLWRVAGHSTPPAVALDRTGPMIIVGTIGKSPIIDGLIRDRKLDVSPVAGQWEGYITAIVQTPYAGTAQALVIAGTDKRGTIFGAYDLSRSI